ncbi:MAG: hypothetical protein IT353_08895 [Gemmatimonadaceae bacterium]|nr:hypothetical protein [Gemmatimonadaceae bacterium]
MITLVAACVPLPRGRAWDSRVVTGKQAGDRLVSAGGMVCNVASAAYAKAQIGDTHRCVWSPPPDARPPQRPSP